MKKIFTLLCLSVQLYAFAQAPFIEWNVTNNNPNILNSLEGPGGITATSDGGFIFSGHTTESSPYNDIVNVKVDSRGSTIWKKKIGFNYNEYSSKIRATADGGFVNICTAEEGGSGFHYLPYPKSSRNYTDMWIAKSNASGTLLWERDYGNIDIEAGFDIRELSDGSFIATGQSGAVGEDVTSHAGGRDMWVLKISATGNVLWSKSYGTTLSEAGRALYITSDGNCVVAGNTGTDGYIVKVNTGDGSLIWSQTVTGTGTEVFNGVSEDALGNLIFSGSTNSTSGIGLGNHGMNDVLVYKTTSTGTLIWSKVFGSTGDDNGYAIVSNEDGSVTVAAGSSAADGDNTLNRGGVDEWIINVSSNGSLVWQKDMGSTGAETGVDIVKAADGGYATLSYTNALGTNGDITCPKGYLWAVKLSGTANTFPAGPILWLKGDVGVTASGGTVTQWNDQSGFGYNATIPSGTTGPQLVSNELNGRPVLRFAGAQALITSAIANFGCRNQMDVFVVMKKQTSTQEQSVLNAFGTSQYGYNDGFEIKGNLKGAASCNNCQADNGYAASMSIEGLQSTNATFNGFGNTNCFTILEAKFNGPENGDEAQLFIDNNRVPRSLGTDNGNTSGAFLPVPLSIGYKTIANVKQNFFNGDIAEIIMFPAVLNDSGRYAVYNSLYNKYFAGNNLAFTSPVATTTISDAFKNDGQWKHPIEANNPNNEMVAVQDKCNELTTLASTTYVEATPIYTSAAGDKFLRRHYTIQATGSHRVRLYFTQAELDDYANNVTGVSSAKDLEVVKYNGPTEDGIYNTSDATTLLSIQTDSTGTLYGALYVEFNSPGFGEFWLRNKAGVLPVKLLSFTAQNCINKVCLKWNTASEINTQSFEVWKSANGLDFKLFLIKNAVGNGDHYYSAVDESPVNGITYYQLKLIDKDGRFTKSNIVQVKIINKPAVALYPNPVQNVLSLTNFHDIKFLEIWSAEGRRVFTGKPGSDGEINITHLARGIYLLRIIISGETINLQFVKQ